MTKNRLNQIAKLGQSIWYDNIQRSLIESGHIAHMIAEDSLTGLTSNPSIFSNSIGKTADYDAAIKAFLKENHDTDIQTLYEHLAISDIQAVADLMLSVYNRTNGKDGFVSLEVSPHLANDTKGTIAEAKRLFETVNRPNLMIKVPGTSAGLPAVTKLISEGINVNVTLMFSLKHYDDVANAYLSGLEKRNSAAGDLSTVNSVASFFVSRVDTIFDNALTKIGTEESLQLCGKMGVANARLAYQRFKEVFGSERFKSLKANGACLQRPLWASTSTKNPEYRDVLYIEELIGSDTVNTMPPTTIEDFRDHGIAELRLIQHVDEARQVMEHVEKLGIDYIELTETLQKEGVEAFAKAFDSLLETLQTKRQSLLK